MRYFSTQIFHSDFDKRPIHSSVSRWFVKVLLKEVEWILEILGPSSSISSLTFHQTEPLYSSIAEFSQDHFYRGTESAGDYFIDL